jgi:hypothetical protein
MDHAGDPVLDRFQLKILVRFAPRQSIRPMNDLLSDSQAKPELDFIGSLVDAEMGAYYHWINQQRLPGASQSAFLAWFEDHPQAVVVSPALPHGVESESAIDLGRLLELALS